MATIKCLVTNILQNIFFCIQQKKETRTNVNNSYLIYSSYTSWDHVPLIFPWKCRGGRLIYVTGQNLNVVQQPKMSVSYEPRERSEVRRRRHTHVSVRNPLVMVKQSENSFHRFFRPILHIKRRTGFQNECKQDLYIWFILTGSNIYSETVIYLTKFELVHTPSTWKEMFSVQ